jgi:hypothetical protein
VIANSAGAVAWALLYGLGGYYFGKGVEEFARPFAIALALVGAIVVASLRPSVTFQGRCRLNRPERRAVNAGEDVCRARRGLSGKQMSIMGSPE